MADPQHHGLEPGDILLGHRRAKSGPADWMTASVIEAVQGTPYGHAAMYVGNGQVVHAHRTLPVAGVHRFPLKQFKELYDFKAYRVDAPVETRQEAADFIKKEVGKRYSAAKMYGSLIPRALGNKREEIEKRLKIREAAEFMCSELIAAAYPRKVFAGKAIESTKPVDLAKSNHTKLVAEFKKEAGSRLRTAVEVVRDSSAPKHLHYFSLKLRGKEIGHLLAREGQTPMVSQSAISPEYRGLGLGKKLYGEVLRQLPGHVLASDRSVSNEAMGVWRGMKTRRGYSLREATNTVPDSWSSPATGYVHGRSMTSSGPMFVAELRNLMGLK